ncbi:MAG: hypothetical protein HYS98_01250, partial [Deltaproteobacteria bacterium]|nr:hypothetical protein [Deltaproteobacteria bacterium]
MKLTLEQIKKLIPQRVHDSHKGSFRPVYALGGSSEKEGAIEMTALAALRVGCGLATIYSFSDLVHVPLEVMFEKLGFFWKRKLSSVIARNAEASRDNLVIALGPGLGTSRRAQKLTKFILENFHSPLVVDADALNCLSVTPALSLRALQNQKGEVECGNLCPIFTPHPGEFSRLTHYSIKEIQVQRESLSVEYKKKMNVILV